MLGGLPFGAAELTPFGGGDHSPGMFPLPPLVRENKDDNGNESLRSEIVAS